MSWFDRPRLLRLAGLLSALTLAGLNAGCFTPLYGSAGAPTAALGNKLAGVEVVPINPANAPNGSRLARVGVDVRNELMFDLNGGGAGATPTYRLAISLSATQLEVLVDINTGRPDFENYGINASYTLTDLSTGKPVVSGTTFSRVSYSIPGQQQRYAGQRGLRDAENRAAKVIADSIRSRLASYFVAGT
jgi:LPS-assembly lipoprotein